MPDGIADATERDLAADQSHTSVVLGETVLVKVYRRLQPGLNPDLEMTAFLSEDAGFAAVPRLAGFAEIVEATGEPTTIAMAQEFVADGADAFEALAEALVAWLDAPGEVSLEVATEVAADLGTLTAGLHAAVADAHGVPGMGPREATRSEVRGWAAAARTHLATALEVTSGEAGSTLVELAPRIAEALTVLDALPTTPEVIRAHGDYHLGQVLIAPDGYRIIDFEGEPTATGDERRAHRPALRDVASMLRSLDHVARSARRRVETRPDGPPETPGLDLDGWIARARERFLEAYAGGPPGGEGLGGPGPGPAARVRDRQGAVRVRLRDPIPAVMAVRPDGGLASAVRGSASSDLAGPRLAQGRPDLAQPVDRLEVERMAEDHDDLVDAGGRVAADPVGERLR